MADPMIPQATVTDGGWKALVPQDVTTPVADEQVPQRQVGPLPEDKPKLGLWETISRTAEQDWMPQAFSRMWTQAGFQYDPDYKLPEEGTPEFKALTKDIPVDQWDRLGSAANAEHAQWIADHIRESNATEELLANQGAFGVAGRFATDLADPVGLALGVATGGIGTAAKGVRMARAARALETAGDLAGSRVALDAAAEFSSKLSPGKLMLKQGALAGSLNAAMTELTVQGDPSRDQWDVAHSALTGFLLGAGMSGIFGRAEINRLRSSIGETRQHLDLAELSQHIETKKAEILDRLANGEHVANLVDDDQDVGLA